MRWACGLGLMVLLTTSTVYTQQATANSATVSTPQSQTDDPSSEGFIDKARRYVEDKQIVDRFFGDRDGWYVRFGGMTTGSGLAVGPGYRWHVTDEGIFVDVSAALSTKVYKAVDANVRWLRLFSQRVELWSDFRYEDFPQEDFFGLGGGSILDARTNYDIDSTDIVGRGLVKILPWLQVGADIGYFNPSIGQGTDDNYPSIEERFSDPTAPGLLAQPNFLHNTVYAEVDYRDQPGSPTTGGRYRASFGRWNDVTLDQFDFHRFDAEAAQFYPIMRRHVIAAHVGVSYVNNRTGHRVPFYFLPYVGGSDTVRGFREFRFRDENVLFLNAEYRWQALAPLDVALFFDAGEVREDWQEIGLQELKTSYGFGVRVHNDKSTFIRLDVGMGGREGRRIFFKLGPSF